MAKPSRSRDHTVEAEFSQDFCSLCSKKLSNEPCDRRPNWNFQGVWPETSMPPPSAAKVCHWLNVYLYWEKIASNNHTKHNSICHNCDEVTEWWYSPKKTKPVESNGPGPHCLRWNRERGVKVQCQVRAGPDLFFAVQGVTQSWIVELKLSGVSSITALE